MVIKFRNIYYLVFVIIISAKLNSQWQIVNVDTSNSRFCDVCVVNQNIIWSTKANNMNNICKTTDGGMNWQTFTGIPEYLYYISAVNENTAWVTTLFGNIYVTNNGGLTWSMQSYNPKAFINFLKFFNENTGFFVADGVHDTVGFFYTRNGGINWSRSQNSPIIPYGLVLLENCVNALDTNFIWMCALISSSNYKFYKLTGGLNSVWQSYSYGVSGQFRNAIFKDSMNGLAAAWDKILITSNGGVNWTLRNGSSIGSWVADFMLVKGTDWIIINNTSLIKISKDFCQTWGNISGFSTYDLYYSDSKDTNSIWVAYNYGKLLKYNFNSIGIIKISNEIPNSFKLYQNYPNPFNPVTKIHFELPIASDFSITVYDITGREVYAVYDSKQAGEYEFTFDGTAFASGIYFYQLKAGDYVDTKKMILLK